MEPPKNLVAHIGPFDKTILELLKCFFDFLNKKLRERSRSFHEVLRETVC